jgi:hypothetical protein
MRALLFCGILTVLTGCSGQENTDMTTPGWAASQHLTPGGNGLLNFQTKLPEIGAYTLQFFLDGPAINPSSTLVRRAEAHITWSVRGLNVSRRVSCVNGMSISGTAEAVSVKVVDTSRLLDAYPREPYLVSVQAARGTRPAIQQPPTLDSVSISLDPGPVVSADIPIPQDAGAISLYTTVTAASALANEQVTVLMRNAGGIVLREYSPLVNTEWVPLPAGASQLRLRSGVLAPVTNWALTFGIDG